MVQASSRAWSRPDRLEAVDAERAGAIQRNWERATEFIAQTGGKLKLISSSTVGFVAAVQQLVSISVVVIGVYQARNPRSPWAASSPRP